MVIQKHSLFNKMNLQEILQDAYQKRHSIQELPSPTKIDKKAAFKPAYQTLKSTKNTPTKNIINHQQQSSQLSGHQSLKQQFGQMNESLKQKTSAKKSNTLPNNNLPKLKR